MAAASRAAQPLGADRGVAQPTAIQWKAKLAELGMHMADDIETIRRVGLQRTYLQAHRAFARLTLEERALWEERAAARAQAFCDGLAADLALIPTPQDADPG